MTVAVLLITHERIGEALLDTASTVFQGAPMPCSAFSVPRDADVERCYEQVLSLVSELDAGDGVLLLSDLYGSTPGNVALRVSQATGGRVVAGANLPMLLRIFNYSRLPLGELTEKAVDGGRAGVVT